jgi:hypothetical protein
MPASKRQSMPFATVESVRDHRSVKMGIMIRTRCSERVCRSGVADPGRRRTTRRATSRIVGSLLLPKLASVAKRIPFNSNVSRAALTNEGLPSGGCRFSFSVTHREVSLSVDVCNTNQTGETSRQSIAVLGGTPRPTAALAIKRRIPDPFGPRDFSHDTHRIDRRYHLKVDSLEPPLRSPAPNATAPPEDSEADDRALEENEHH